MAQSLCKFIQWPSRIKRCLGWAFVALASLLFVVHLVTAKIESRRFREEARNAAKYELDLRKLLTMSTAEKDKALTYSDPYLEELTLTTFLMRQARFVRSMYEKAGLGDAKMIQLAREAGGRAEIPYFTVILDDYSIQKGGNAEPTRSLSKMAMPEYIRKAGPNSIAGFYADRAGNAINLGDYELALAYLAEAICFDSHNSSIFVVMGWVRYRLGQFLEARNDFMKAAELSPTYFESWVFLCESYLSMDPPDPSAAIESLKQASINIDGGLIPSMQFLDRIIPVRAYSRLAWIISTVDQDDLRDPELAIQICDRLLTNTNFTKEMQAELLRTRAAAYAASGQFTKAVGDQTEAIAMSNNSMNMQFADELQSYRNMMPLRCPVDPIRQLYISKEYSLAEPLPRPSKKR